MTQTSRIYDIVVLGATGYTASIVAEYATNNLPTDLKWAVAGRSEEKLTALVEKLKSINSCRQSPALEVVELELTQLSELASKSRLVINGIGPYHLFSSPVIEACAKNGTHYIGFSLEVPWIQKMIEKYDAIARKNGSIIVPTIALAPSDMVAFLVAKTIHEQPQSKGTAEVNSTAKLELQGMSGGSLNTVISLISTYGISWIWPGNPWSLTQDLQDANKSTNSTFLSRFFGSRNIDTLGICTTSFLSICNESIAHRSAALQPQVYGPDFHFHEFLPTSTFISGTLVHFITRMGLLLLAFSPFRALLQLLIPPGGSGPYLASAQTERQVFHAVGQPSDGSGRRVQAKFDYKGSLYYCSAAMGVEAALVILNGEKVPAFDIGGGVLTPAMLGMPFAERLRDIGVKLEVGKID